MDKNRLQLILSLRLKTALFEAGMTCAELSRKAGMSTKTLSNIARAKCLPSVDKVAMIAENTGRSVDWLIGLTDDPAGHYNGKGTER